MAAYHILLSIQNIITEYKLPDSQNPNIAIQDKINPDNITFSSHIFSDNFMKKD